ncbi:MAG: polyhydroxyalkanoic acid system family protein [Bdellovibrionaceae bacterium]|nr:polyhydroxyalkanoic acid system family protein [Pseudobdellovibrionaceae bacterium]
MAKFTVEYQNKHSADVAFSKVKELLTKGDDLKKYDSSLQCKFNDQNMTCQIKGGKFGAELIVAPQGASSLVSIAVDLPLLLLPFKSKVQESLSRMLHKHLG